MVHKSYVRRCSIIIFRWKQSVDLTCYSKVTFDIALFKVPVPKHCQPKWERSSTGVSLPGAIAFEGPDSVRILVRSSWIWGVGVTLLICACSSSNECVLREHKYIALDSFLLGIRFQLSVSCRCLITFWKSWIWDKVSRIVTCTSRERLRSQSQTHEQKHSLGSPPQSYLHPLSRLSPSNTDPPAFPC